jgi:L-alanine-DL-glutamate epimerase-like enolase superfamily enzyme
MTRTRRTRRRFLEQLVTGAALSAAAPSLVSADSSSPSGPSGAPEQGAASSAGSTGSSGSGGSSGNGRYDYLGRTPGYRDWAVVPRGLTVKSIETFQREQLALVRITASDGKTGWGQIAPYEADISTEVLHRLIARLVIGRDISEIDAINDAVIDAQLKFPWSFLCRALAGVDTALWDLYGQITGKPVAVLLGGSVRPLPAYGSSMRRDISPADEATRLAKLRDELGCKAFKIRLGTPGGRNRDAAPGRSEAIIPAVRKAVGPNIELHADANSCYTPDVAIEFGRRLEDANYAAFEEPCPYWELEWTQEVTRTLKKIDVQGGEQDNDLAQFRRMIAMRAVDIVQPDICYVGGLTRAWRVAKMAEAAGLVTKPHAANVSLVTVFTMHLLAALPKAGEVEFSIENDASITKQARAMFDPVLEMKDGRAVMPDGPGWGVRIKPDWLAGAQRRTSPAPAKNP